jgi:hypothetical protein
MKSSNNRLILLFAIIGVCAVLYVGWRIYQEQVAQDQKRNFFAAPASSASGAPDAFHNAPPPPQP